MLDFFKKINDKAAFSPDNKILITNFLSLSSLQLFNCLLPLITLPYLIRVLQPDRFGLVAFAQSLIGYFVIITDYGFNYSATREISIRREDTDSISRVFCSVMAVKVAAFIISLALLSLVIFNFRKFSEAKALYYLSFLMVFGNVLFPVWFFQGVEKMQYIVFLNAMAKIIFTVSIFIFVNKPSDYLYVPLLNSLGYIISGAAGIWIAVKQFGVRLRLPARSDIAYQVREGWHVFISTVGISSYTYTRLFAVGLLTNNVITGYYAIADKLISIIQSLTTVPLVQTLYPRLSKMYSDNTAKSLAFMAKMQAFMTGVSVLILPILMFFSPFIIRIVSGNLYDEAVITFRLLLIGLFFNMANAFRVNFLLVSGRKNEFARIHVLAGFVGICAAFAGTALFSYIGAASVFIFMEALVFLLTSMVPYKCAN